MKLFNTKHVYAAPEPNDSKRKKEYITECVYAGPEDMEARRFDPNAINPFIGYPYNNLPPAKASFEMIYAAPGNFPGQKTVNDGSQNGMDSANKPDAESLPEGYVICPTCGEKTRNWKFCECCGDVLEKKNVKTDGEGDKIDSV